MGLSHPSISTESAFLSTYTTYLITTDEWYNQYSEANEDAYIFLSSLCFHLFWLKFHTFESKIAY
jgi:hypothetical protein